MQHSPTYGFVLVIVVAALSLVAGLVVVALTSPESLRLASAEQAASATPTLVASDPAPAQPSESATQNMPQTVEATPAPATPSATATSAAPTETPSPQPTDTPATTPTVTATSFPTLAPDAVAVGRIVTQNNSTARLRSVPGLDGKVIAAVQPGEFVQVLGGQTKIDDISWVPVRLNSGLQGWVAVTLVQTFP